MKRRTFLLGGGLLASLSLGATATNASLADTVSSVANFQAVEKIEREASLSANPSTSSTPSKHTWTTTDITTGTTSTDDTQVDTIEANYDFDGDAASFDGLGPSDITVKIDRNGDGSKTDISVNSTGATDISGTVAVFELSGIPDTNIAGDMELIIDGIENPSTSGSFRPSLTLTNYNGDSISTEADLTIVEGQSLFNTTITNIPTSFSVNNAIQVDYQIENTGDQTDTQPIRFLVDGTQEDSTAVTLDPQNSTTGSFSYTPTSSDGSSLDIRVESDDDSDTKIVTKGNTFSLSLDPSTAGATDAIHTWSAETINTSEFNDGEAIDTVEVDYSDSSQGSTLNNLDQADIFVTLTRELDEGPDRVTLTGDDGDTGINDDDYSGDTATFDLSGFYDTDSINDPNNPDIVVTIGDSDDNTGAENPSQGSYTATITLNGENGSSVSDTVSYETT